MLVAASCALWGTAHAAEPWNPQPSAGDVIFPLPCNEKMVFRPVFTSEARDGSATPLTDRRVLLGSQSQERGYLDYLRDEHIAGPFIKDRRRFFLMGKYEVTIAQYKAVVLDACDFAPQDRSMPVARVSWFDAQTFVRKLTAYLLRNARDLVRRETGTPKAFARLPTETEWEFAVRGGLAVSPADFQANLFPLQGGDLKNHAWVNDPQSAEDVNPIGERTPNPLGLHDMYGNLAEMMLEPFRMNRAGRLHGLAGGVILKGGSFQTSPAFISSAGREEDALFNEETGEEKRARSTGFRVVLAGPAVPPGTDGVSLAQEWTRLNSTPSGGGERDPIATIQRVREGVADLEIANGLTAIEQAVRTQAGRGSEEKKELVGGLLVGLGRAIEDTRRLQSGIDARAANARANGAILGDVVLKSFASQDADARRTMEANLHFAHDILVGLSQSATATEVTDQARTIAGDLTIRNLSAIADGVMRGAGIFRRMAGNPRGMSRETLRTLVLE